MPDISVYIISFIQIASDLACVFISAILASRIKQHRVFYVINCLSFIALSFSDFYYNYLYRILKLNILLSAGSIDTLPLIIFQMLQFYSWYTLIKKQNKLFSWLNLPYLLFATAVTSILVYFFYINNSFAIPSTMKDMATLSLDMPIWVFAIISLGRTKNSAVAFLALGCLMIISSDLTFTCLFMFDMDNVAVTKWPHMVWAVGAFLMAIGFFKSKKQQDFSFHDPDSIHAKCNWWLLISSLIAFLIGLVLPFFFIESKNVYTIRYALWDVPISLMFTMIASTLLGNRFSKIILSPIRSFSQSIEAFNMGKQSDIQINNDINEFKILSDFISKSFAEITGKLEQEVKISAQVAHDVRSPLSALEIGIRSLPPTLDESKRILMRDAVQHIKDITNILDKSDCYNKSNEMRYPTQVAVLLDNVISDRRLALSNHNVKFNQLYESDKYEYFSNIVPPMFKRILTNILNNSYEAIEKKDGIIAIDLYEEDGMCIISITDNGRGISDIDFKSLFTRGFSTKKDGHGLGLYHAKEALSEWDANIEIMSSLNEGTEVKITIPLVEPPLWFVNQLSLLEDEIIVCIDDSLSVYQTWLERFKSFNGNHKLIYCPNKESFLAELEHLKYRSATYLIDYEFSGKSYQGHDFSNLILMLGNRNNRVFMVTSRSGEKNIQDYCVKNSIHIIPKNFSVKIPLQLFDKQKKSIILTAICDKEISLLNKSSWHIYSNANDFISDMPYFDSSHQIYIQQDIDRSRIDDQLKLYGLCASLFDKISCL
jgi:signal transduction histidine kinase